jgi:hypothetical protein
MGLCEPIADRIRCSAYADSLLTQTYGPDYEIGDLVLAFGHLAEVLEKRVSKYGLHSYRVRFVVQGPLKETPEDWVPADGTGIILRKRWSRSFLRQHWSKKAETQDLLDIVDSCSDDELVGFLRPGLIDLEKRGVPLPTLVPTEEDTDIK